MKTIDKAVYLLGFFTTETPEFRLSDLAHAAGIDKVTASRVLNSLAAGGLVERHPETRKYRLGREILRLARIRETCFPVVSVLQPIADELAARTGESAHAALRSKAGLTTIALCEPNRSIRVWIDPAQVLPFHATASGLAFLAHSAPDFVEEFFRTAPRKGCTAQTVTEIGHLRTPLAETRQKGFAVSVGTLEIDTVGIAAPVFDWHGNVMATIAVACIRSRVTEEVRSGLETEVLRAAAMATEAFGGKSPSASAPARVR